MSQLVSSFSKMLQKRARAAKVKQATAETAQGAQERFDRIHTIKQIYQEDGLIWIYIGMQSTAFDINLDWHHCFDPEKLREDQMAKVREKL